MQRLARIKNPYQPEQIVYAEHVIRLMNRHLPPTSRTLVALPTPIPDSESLDWLSARTGQIRAFAELNTGEQNQLLAQVQTHQRALTELQEKLAAKGDHNSASLIAQLLSSLDKAELFSVDGHPVCTNWLSPPEAAPAATTAPLAPVAAPTIRSWRWLWALLLLLLVLALLFAVWYFWLHKPKHAATPTPPPAPVSESVSPPTTPAQNYACMAKQAHEVLPPDFTVIFDNSASMSLSLSVSREDELWYLGTDEFTLEELAKVKSLFTGISRFEVAQSSITDMIKTLHPDIATRLMSFGTCGTVYDHGVFSSQQQPQFIREVARLKPESATPSAQALYEAAQKMDGVERDGIIVLFIDGEDGCGDDICAVADLIAQEKPRIRVNVVDISNFGLSNCVAQKTGGRVYSSNNAVQINEMLKNSIQELSATPEC